MADDKKDEKEEKKKKKEYDTIKVKRGALEQIRDFLAIVRDILLILFLIGLVALIYIGILLLLNIGPILNSLGSSGLGSLFGGGAGSIGALSTLGTMFGNKMVAPSSGSGTKTISAGGDAQTCQLMTETKSAFEAGDFDTAQQKLTQLKSNFKKNKMTDQEKIIDQIVQAASAGDVTTLISSVAALENSVRC